MDVLTIQWGWIGGKPPIILAPPQEGAGKQLVRHYRKRPHIDYELLRDDEEIIVLLPKSVWE